MYGLMDRTQRTAQGIAEAMSAVMPPAPAPGLSPQAEAGGAPVSGPLPSVLAQPPVPPGGMPPPQSLAVRPNPTAPLGTMSDFRSPPMAAALQGARGAQGPVSFARGGLAVFRG